MCLSKYFFFFFSFLLIKLSDNIDLFESEIWAKYSGSPTLPTPPHFVQI